MRPPRRTSGKEQWMFSFYISSMEVGMSSLTSLTVGYCGLDCKYPTKTCSLGFTLGIWRGFEITVPRRWSLRTFPWRGLWNSCLSLLLPRHEETGFYFRMLRGANNDRLNPLKQWAQTNLFKSVIWGILLQWWKPHICPQGVCFLDCGTSPGASKYSTYHFPIITSLKPQWYLQRSSVLLGLPPNSSQSDTNAGGSPKQDT